MTDPAVPWSGWLLDLLFPSRCAACGRAWARHLRRVAGAALVRLRGPLCAPLRRADRVAGRPLPRVLGPTSRVRLGPRRRCLRRGAPVRSCGRGRSAASARSPPLPPSSWPTSCRDPAADVITYIPPDGDRSLRRGHHPARALAGELGALWEIDVLPLLVRTRPVGRQTGLSLGERRRNVRGAFAATRAACRRRSSSSTTSTRPARRSARPRRPCGRPARRASTSSPSHGPFARRAPEGVAVRPASLTCVQEDDCGSDDYHHQGGRDAASGEGTKRRDHAVGPGVRGDEAREARQAACRPRLRSSSSCPRRRTALTASHVAEARSSRRGRRCGRASRPGHPRRRSTAGRQPRAAGEAVPREAPPRADGGGRRTTALEPLPAARAAPRAGSRAKAARRDRRTRAARRPAWDAAGIHGLHRARQWDAVDDGRGADASSATGPSSSRCPPASSWSSDGPDDVEPLAAPVERELAPPYRAEAVRRDGTLWAVAARRIEVVELPGLDGEELELTVHGDERTPGRRRRARRSARSRRSSGPSSRARAYRIDGDVWEVEIRAALARRRSASAPVPADTL